MAIIAVIISGICQYEPDVWFVQEINGMRPYIQEQKAVQDSNADRMAACKTEEKRLGKLATDAQLRYTFTLLCFLCTSPQPCYCKMVLHFFTCQCQKTCDSIAVSAQHASLQAFL